jgi:hypothetical protein
LPLLLPQPNVSEIKICHDWYETHQIPGGYDDDYSTPLSGIPFVGPITDAVSSGLGGVGELVGGIVDGIGSILNPWFKRYPEMAAKIAADPAFQAALAASKTQQ